MKDNLSDLAFFNCTRGKILSGIETFITIGGSFSLTVYITLILVNVPANIPFYLATAYFLIFGTFGFLLGYYKSVSFIFIKLFPATKAEIITYKHRNKIGLTMEEQKYQHELNITKFLKLKIP